MIEFIGVMAVLSILAAAAVPSIVKRLDQSAWTAEGNTLQALSDGFVQTISKNRQIPAAADWPQAIAAYLNYSVSQIQTNPRRYSRVFLRDPNLSIAGADLPYTQTTAGSATAPSNARVMMLSTVAKALPSLGSISASDFNNIWTNRDGTVPAALSSWGGKADDLVVQRLDVASLFHKIVLVNVDQANVGKYSIDTASITSVATGPTRVVAYYLHGTVLNLYRPDSTLDFREIIHEDASFVYQNNRWGRRFGSSDEVLGDFGYWVNQFLLPPAPSDPKFAATQQSVINAFYDYLWGYCVWATGDPSASPVVPPFAGAGTSSTSQYPSYTVVAGAQVNLATFTDNLIH